MINVRVDKFGALPRDTVETLPHDNEVVQKAFQFLKPIVLKYVNNEILDKAALVKERDDRYKEMFGTTYQQGVKHGPTRPRNQEAAVEKIEISKTLQVRRR